MCRIIVVLHSYQKPINRYKSQDPTGSVWLKTTESNLGAKWSVKKWNDTTKLWETVSAHYILATNRIIPI